MTTELELEPVASAFKEWQLKNKKSSIPSDFKQKILQLTSETRIQLAVEPVDFRRQIEGLVLLCKNQLQQIPNSGVCFVFINRARTMIRILVYQNNGYWLLTKRLSRGRYGG